LIIQFLGTGTSQGIPVVGCTCDACVSEDVNDKRLRSSILVRKNNTNILVDCGPDLRQQLLINKIDNVDAILLTHEHNDHTAGLDDIRPINFKQNKIIPLYGQDRVIKNMQSRYNYALCEHPYPGSPRISTHVINPLEKFNIGYIDILPINYLHGNLEVMGYIFDRKAAYLTDLSSIEDKNIQLLENLDVLILDALQIEKHHAHLSLEEAINLSTKINANSTYLIHMSHTMGLVKIWSQLLPPNINPSYDGLTLEL
jgi:phosphoribosyl 1,2-cyclic phosphate phosphodiesterase